MEWTTLSFIGILIGGVGALLWQRHRMQGSVLTRQTVRCPLDDCQATIVVRTNPLAQLRRQHVDVATCSLHPATLVTLPGRKGFVPDISYDKPYQEAPGRYPGYPLEVPCHKNCIAILNKAAGSWATQPLHCTSQASHSSDVVLQITHNPAMAQALWFHSVLPP